MPLRLRDVVPMAALTLTVLGHLVGADPRGAATIPPAKPTVAPATAQRLIAVAPHERLATWLTQPTTPSATAGGIVLLPGTLGSVYSMRLVSSQLTAQGYAVLVIDPLGMGASDRPRDADYTLAKQAERIVAVLDSVGWRSVRMAAHGTSATIAFHVAARAPERISHIVSIAGGPIDSQRTGGVESALRVSGVLDNRVGRAMARRKFAAQLRERSAEAAWVTDAAIDAYLAPLMRDLSGTLRVLQRMGETREPMPIGAVLSRVRASVTLLTGDVHTPGAPTAAQTELLMRAVPHARVERVARSGAMLHEESPQAVVRSLVESSIASGAIPQSPSVPVGQMTLRGRSVTP